MALIPQRFIDDLLDKVDIVDVVGSRISLRKSGKNYSARCPFHDEKTPSFTVSPDKQFYYCFGCGAGGNAIGFVMDYDRTDFPQAVEQLARHAGLEVPRESRERDPADSRRKQLYSLLAEAEKYYRAQLRQHPDAKLATDYLKKRGLTGAIAGQFAIGFAPPGWDNLIGHLGHDDQRVRLLLEAGLVIQKEDSPGRVYDRFRQRIMFPIRDTRGRTIGFGGRVLGNDKPKYLNSPETPVFHKGSELYGLYEAHTTLREIPNLLVVEGYMDVVALAQHGIHNAVATLGTAATAEHLAKLFRYTAEVIFCFDGDNAGRQAARRALETCLPAMTDGRSARFLFLPEGEDPDTLVRKLGAEGFTRLLADAQPLSEFLFHTLGESLNLATVDGKARLSKLAAPLIHRIPEGVYRQLMLKQLARLTDMDLEALKAIISEPEPAAETVAEGAENPAPPAEEQTDEYADYAHLADRSHHPGHDYDHQPSPPLAPARRLKLSAVQRLILLLLHSPELGAELAQLGDLDSLDDPDTEILINLAALLREHPDYSLNHILGFWRGIHGPGQGELLARIAACDLARPPDHAPRDHLAEFRDICRHLEKRIHRERPAMAQLEALLARDSLDTDDRKRLLDIWHHQIPDTDRTEELNSKIKQALAKRSGQRAK
ncbi:MAG: DNA primase [Porticoccaceae bacterium]|jgi:DNA primase|nr:DNA primase [Porticoccaceae bacterium]MEA3299192.1 DNA primase [Pseudomonadota bacterium]